MGFPSFPHGSTVAPRHRPSHGRHRGARGHHRPGAAQGPLRAAGGFRGAQPAAGGVPWRMGEFKKKIQDGAPQIWLICGKYVGK